MEDTGDLKASTIKRNYRTTIIHKGGPLLFRTAGGMVLILLFLVSFACSSDKEEPGKEEAKVETKTISIGIGGTRQHFVYDQGKGIVEVDNEYDVIKGAEAVRKAGYTLESGKFEKDATTVLSFDDGNSKTIYLFKPDGTVVFEIKKPEAVAGTEKGSWLILSD